MPLALMSSGGKDSTLALDRAVRQGLNVRFLANVYHAPTGRVRFHGVRHQLIARQGQALGLELVSTATDPAAFEPVFVGLLETLKARGATGVVFGNIHLADVRGWYEERVQAAGFTHHEPLWGDDPATLARELVDRGYRSVVVSADLALGAGDLVGREIDRELLAELASRPELDVCGERGEYHSFVYAGPLFKRPVAFTRGEVREIEGYRFLDLVPAQ